MLRRLTDRCLPALLALSTAAVPCAAGARPVAAGDDPVAAVGEEARPARAASEAAFRVTFRGGRRRDVRSLERLPSGDVRLQLLEGGEITVPEIYLLDVDFAPGSLPADGDGASLPPQCDPVSSERIGRWDELISRSAARHGLPADLVRAVLAVESCGDPSAVSHAGAIGLMQLMPDTALELGCSNPEDPQANVDAGCRHLARLHRDLEGDLDLVLAAYNAGEGAVSRHGAVPPYRETRRYVKLVKTQLARLALR